MAVKCVFTAKKDQVLFRTRTNGDHVHFDRVKVDADNAADLARLIQNGVELEITIKEK